FASCGMSLGLFRASQIISETCRESRFEATRHATYPYPPFLHGDSERMSSKNIRKRLPELRQLEDRFDRSRLIVSEEVRVEVEDLSLPVYSVEAKPFRKGLPTVIFTAGVHGIERIGSQVLLAYMDMLVTRSPWDKVLQHQLDALNIVFVP